MTEQKQEYYANLLRIIELGANDARTMTRGVLFQGAMNFADFRGIKRDAPEYDAYINGYINTINELYPDGVPVDSNGIVFI